MAVDTGEIDASGPVGEATSAEDLDVDVRGARIVERLGRTVPALIIVACCVFVAWQLRPDLLLRDTTANGGDMGAHVWFPAYLRDHLLPHFRLAGWSPDWYAGFPAGQFYFPLPALLIVAADLVLPYNVAFKLVTALGPIAMPAAAYAFARGLRLRAPAPALCAPAVVVFLFFKGAPGASTSANNIAFNQGIMGGTLRSNLAGEFSYTIALALALCFLGALAVALRDFRRPWLPAALLAAVILSHLVVGIFAAVGGIVVWLFHRPLRTAPLAAVIAGVGALLTAVWTVPLVATFGYTANMRYEKLTAYVTYLFPTYFWWVFALAAVAVVMACVRRDRGVLVLIVVTVLFGVVFRAWPDAHAWNLRFLPLWYVGLFLLAGVGVAEGVSGAARLVQWAAVPADDDDPAAPAAAALRARRSLVTSATVGAIALVLTVITLWRVDATKGFLGFWADWNYSGYQDTSGTASGSHRPKPWPEFRALVDQMRALPPGRALWEGGSAIDAYGTPLALMMLPYFTHGHTASMEGLYFESSATTPYHFMAAATLEGPGNASNPVRGLDYRTISDFDLGVRYLRLFGVRYYLAFSQEAKQHADANPGLRAVATVADRDGKPPLGWNVYEVLDAPVVAPLANEPVVATGARPGTHSECFGSPRLTPDPELGAWECLAANWFDDARALDRPLAADGPASWARAPADRAKDAARRPLPAVTVRGVRTTDESIRFDVSRPGVPIVVKTSYFPNWVVSGAKGPYRITPNLMVVVPTGTRVELRYSRTAPEWAGIAGSAVGLVGLAGLVALGRRRPPRGARRDPALR